MRKAQSGDVKETYLTQKPNPMAANMALVSLLVICLFSWIYWEQIQPLHSYLPANREKVFVDHQYWRLFTSMAVHFDLAHLLANSLPFGVFVYLVFGYYGAFNFPLLTLALGALVDLLVLLTYSEGTTLVGASGLVYLLAGFWLMMYIFIDRRYSVIKRFMRATGFALVTLFPTSFDERVSYRTHAMGFIVGILWAFFYFLPQKSRFRDAEIVEVNHEDLI